MNYFNLIKKKLELTKKEGKKLYMKYSLMGIGEFERFNEKSQTFTFCDVTENKKYLSEKWLNKYFGGFTLSDFEYCFIVS